MPPRYAYWTILVDNLPTAFRATTREDLQPTFEQLRRKNPTAVMRWFARGTLWDSPEHAARAGREDGERRAKGWRPGGDHRDPRERFEQERKAKNAARRQERFDQKAQRRRGEGGSDARPPDEPRRAAIPHERPRFENRDRPEGRGPHDDRRHDRPHDGPHAGRSRNERDRPQGRPPAERPFDHRGGPDRPGPRGARPFDARNRPPGRGPRDDRPRGDRDRPQGRPPGGRPFDDRGGAESRGDARCTTIRQQGAPAGSRPAGPAATGRPPPGGAPARRPWSSAR